MRTFSCQELDNFVEEFDFRLDRYDAARGIYTSPSLPGDELYVFTRLVPSEESGEREILMGASLYTAGNKEPLYSTRPDDYHDGVDLQALGDFICTRLLERASRP